MTETSLPRKDRKSPPKKKEPLYTPSNRPRATGTLCAREPRIWNPTSLTTKTPTTNRPSWPAQNPPPRVLPPPPAPPSPLSPRTNPPPLAATCQSSFEQGVALALHLWPALTLAVQSNWGGSDSEDKRAWFAGAIVELFPDLASKPKPNPTSKPSIAITTQQQQQKSTAAAEGPEADDDEPDAVDVEAVLLQVMLDEFDVNVDDDSAYEVAEQIVRVRAECARGKFDGELAGLQRRFDARGGTKVVGVFKKVEDEDAETDWDTDDDEDEDDSQDGDVPMGDAPPKKEKEEPEVDEDGFTKVSRRKR